MEKLTWSCGNLPSRNYTCGHCGSPIASEKGWHGQLLRNNSTVAHIYICHQCTRPTFFDGTVGNKQVPGVVFGESVKHIPDHLVETLYNEARACTGAACYTAAVLCCRKLLMHVAVSLGATAGGTFVTYVQFLADNHYVPPGAKVWVDHIRTKGNEATHEIVIIPKEDAEELLSFAEMLLKVIYEFPAVVQQKLAP